MTKAKLQSSPPERPTGSKQEPKRWAKKTHPHHPKEEQWSENPGYETKQQMPVGNMPALARWINDMTDWGLMMHEEVMDLTERVRELEERCVPQN